VGMPLPSFPPRTAAACPRHNSAAHSGQTCSRSGESWNNPTGIGSKQNWQIMTMLKF